MNHLSIEVNNKPCVFVLQISEPAETLKKLAMFWQDNHVVIENLQMHRYRNGEGMAVVHALVEVQHMQVVVMKMEELPGVMKLEILK